MKRLIGVLLGTVVIFAAASSEAQTFTMSLLGSRETAGGDPAGRGLAVITINGGNVYYFLWVQNIASPTIAHIHTGVQGVSGPIYVGFAPTWTNVATSTYMAAGSVPVDSSTTAPILANPTGYYVNVHNGPYPNGAIRGQMLGDGPASYALSTTLLGFREVPPGSSSGQGYTAILFDPVNTMLYYYLWETAIDAPTMAHVHTGPAGVAGPILVNLQPTFTSGQAFGAVPVDVGTLASIQASPDQYYVNIHTGDFPAGALRGQLAATEYEAMVTVAAHNAGLGTSFYRTDMRVLSLTDQQGTVFGEWYPHGVANSTGPAATAQFTLPAGGEAVYDDVVSTLFSASTRGAIRLMSAFPFAETARNYNDQRSTGGGTYGEDNPGLGVDGALTSGALLLNSNQPQTSGQGFRTNVGYFNPSPYSVNVTFNVRNPDGSLVAPPSTTTLPPWDDDQALFYQFIPGIPSSQDTLTNFYITFTASNPIYLFSSPVDNVTGNGIHQTPVPFPAAMTQPAGGSQSAAPTGTITMPPGNISVTQGTAVQFQGTGSDPKGEALTVHWDFGDSSIGSGYSASHTYANTGTFTVKMTVTNTDGISDPNPPTRVITVASAQQSGPPTGTITTPSTNITAYTGYPVSFAGTGTDPKGETLTAKWDFGDGTNATGFTATHTYSSTGTYTVTFTVTNTDGVSDPNPPTRTINVINYAYGN